MNNKDLQELLNETFYDNITLEENVFITPLIAFGAFKKNIKSKLKNSNIAQKIKNFSNLSKEAKTKALISSEKAKAGAGMKSGKGKDASVYKLTDAQIDAMEDIYNKYGNELIKEIVDFRKNVLAPYSLIKRLIKNNKQLTSKETYGITKEEFKKALESGRKKIQNRGKNYREKREEIQERINNLDEAKKHIEQVKKDFKSGKRIDKNVLRKIYINYDLGENEFGEYNLSQLEKTYNELVKGSKDVAKKLETGNTSGAAELVKKQAELRKGSVVKSENAIDLTKNKEKFFDQGKFKDSLGKYFLRKEVVNDLMSDPNSPYRKTYESIINNMENRLTERRKKIFSDLLQLKKSTEFNSKEEKVWEPVAGVKDSFSGDISDYKQKVKEDDFFDPEHFEKSDELVKAQRNIENEIKKFNRKVKSIVSDEDYEKLKKLRLINTIITVGELGNKDKVFASPDEIKKDFSGSSKDTDKEETVSTDDFEKDLRYVATTEFDSVSELNKAKKDLKKKYDSLDDDDKEKYETPMKRVEFRRDTEKQDASYLTDFLGSQDFDSDDVEKFLRKMLNKKYETVSEVKQDRETLDYMMDQYKKENKDDYEKNIKDIDFLIKRVEARFEDIESDLKYDKD